MSFIINILRMLGHSKTTENLMNSLSKLKQLKQQMTDKLRASIDRNNQVYEHHSASSRRLSQRLITNRQHSIDIFQAKLNNKLKSDELNSAKLDKVEQEALRKRMEIERRIEEIGNRNSQRMRELQLMEEQVVRKIQQDLEKNEAKEKHLRAEYVRIQREERQVSQTKAHQKKESIEQWRLLQAEKWRIEALAREHEERQSILIQEKNPVPTRKEEKKRHEDKYIPTEKEYNRLKSPAVVNSKEMGNQYLEQAKLLHREHINKRNKKKLMNINLKVVNYAADMMEKIYRNTSDLSNFQPPKQPLPDPPNEVRSESSIPVTLTPLPRFELKLQDDGETERYIKQIKNNLQELTKDMNEEGEEEREEGS